VTRTVPAIAVLIPLAGILLGDTSPGAHDQQLFREIFSEGVCRFDTAAVAKLKTVPAGTRVSLDTDGDGKIDTMYFIDPDAKHEARFRPILVKAIDRDGDMERDGAPDTDSDLYVADVNADGTVDSVVEYIDRDRDNALDEMAIYTYSANNRNLGTDTIQAWWSRDVGHDHKLWQTINYRYQQKECQFRCDFNGDEVFANYVYDSASKRWIPGWENPFGFYDEDRDGIAEVVIRFSGKGDRMESMRYSFDADNDATRAMKHNYDFGFTCLASRKQDDGRTIPLPPQLTESITLHSIPAGPVLGWKHARKFGESADWGRILMAWVEDDNNVDSRPDGDPHNRWEGVIASGTEHFPQVGGPPVGPFNVRYEADLDNSGRMQLYNSPVDGRIHLRGADEGWLKADYDHDGKVDFAIFYVDTDKDGIVDTWKFDLDGDGTVDRTMRAMYRPKPVPLHYATLSDEYRRIVADAVRQNADLTAALKTFLEHRGADAAPDAAEQYFETGLIHYRESEGVGKRIHDSAEGRRFYGDISRERYFNRLTKAVADDPKLSAEIDRLYNGGEYTRLARLLRRSVSSSHRAR
jgi:hypothetical protein